MAQYEKGIKKHRAVKMLKEMSEFLTSDSQ